MRGKDLFIAAPQDISIGGVRIPQVGGVDRSVRIQNLGEAQSNDCTGRTFHLQGRPSHHVLPHVEDVGSLCERRDFLRVQRGDHPRGRGYLAGNRDGGRIGGHCRIPPGIVKANRLPSSLFQECVVHFSGINLRSNDGRCCRLPASVGHNRFAASVGVSQFELR